MVNFEICTCFFNITVTIINPLNMKFQMKLSILSALLLVSFWIKSTAQNSMLDMGFRCSDTSNVHWINSILSLSDGSILRLGDINITGTSGVYKDFLLNRMSNSGVLIPGFSAASILDSLTYGPQGGGLLPQNRIFKRSNGNFLVSTGGSLFEFTAEGNYVPGFQFAGTYTIEAIAEDANGKIWVGGKSNPDSPFLARLLPNGNLDQNFSSQFQGNGPNHKISCLAINGLGQILVGGTFYQYQGNSVSGVIRILSNGNIDPSFNTIAGESWMQVNALYLLSNGNVLVSGRCVIENDPEHFDAYVEYLGTGMRDPAFSSLSFPASWWNYCRELVVNPDGSFFAISPDENGKDQVIKVLPNGQVNQNFIPLKGFSSLINSPVIHGIQRNGNESIYVFGEFNKFENQSREGLARFNGAQFRPVLTSVPKSAPKDVISMYPNPVWDILTLEGVQENCQVEILGITGALQKTFQFSRSSPSFSVSGLQKGMYQLKVLQGGSVQILPLLVQ